MSVVGAECYLTLGGASHDETENLMFIPVVYLDLKSRGSKLELLAIVGNSRQTCE